MLAAVSLVSPCIRLVAVGAATTFGLVFLFRVFRVWEPRVFDSGEDRDRDECRCGRLEDFLGESRGGEAAIRADRNARETETFQGVVVGGAGLQTGDGCGDGDRAGLAFDFPG